MQLSRCFSRRMALPTAGLAILTLAASLVTAERAPAAESTCPATFHVLHDDRIGQLRLPEGHYRIILLDSSRLSCTHASDLFAQFLEDYTGDLPGRWRVIARRSEFRRGNSDVGFRVERTDRPSGGGGGGRHPATGRACPGFFRVLHNDRIGRLRLPAGEYRITLLATGRLSCQRADRLFARFLEDWNGRLPGRWRLDVRTATFSKRRHFGFRVKPASGGDGGGGGRHPARGQRRCPGTFRVLHNDRIGKLRLPAGRYRITLIRKRRITCSRAERLFARFLDHPSGLPGRWVLVERRSASFRRGPNGFGFRIKLVR